VAWRSVGASAGTESPALNWTGKDTGLSVMAKAKVHAEAIVELAISLLCFTMVTTHAVKRFGKLVVDCGGNLAGHDVVNMKISSLLISINEFVCYTGIVRVENVFDRFKIGTELFTPEQDSLEHARKCLKCLKVKDFATFLVDCEHAVIIGCDLDEQVNQHASNFHDDSFVTILKILEARLDEIKVQGTSAVMTSLPRERQAGS